MKKIIVFAFTATLALQCFSQTNFTLYGVKFKAAEILGRGQADLGYSGQTNRTEFIGDKNTNGLYKILGQTYHKDYMKVTTPLLDIYAVSEQPILDEINLTFYHENGFELMAGGNPVMDTDPGFKKFKEEFEKLYNENKKSEARKFLYDPANRAYRVELEKLRYRTIVDRTFSLALESSKNITGGFQADVEAVIYDYIGLNVKIPVKASKIIETAIAMDNARYVQIEFQEDYLAYIINVLTKYDKDRSLFSGKSDRFSGELLHFFDAPDMAIITGAAVLQLQVNYNKYSNMISEIGASLKADLQIPDSDIAKISAELEVMFKSNTRRQFSMNTGVTYFNLAYGYQTRLELGEGAPPQK